MNTLYTTVGQNGPFMTCSSVPVCELRDLYRSLLESGK